jgi:mycofactocin precursor
MAEIAQVADTATVEDDDVVVVIEELLVEEVSIDGMCGVY